MSYSIKHTTVTLTTDQLRFVLTGLEAIRDGKTIAGPEERANALLQYLKDQDVLSEHDYAYGLNRYPQSSGTITCAPLDWSGC